MNPDSVTNAARELGFDIIGITGVEPLPDHLAALGDWCSSGFAAGMDYMTRRPELHGSPKLLVPSAVSLITLGVNYYVSAAEFRHENRYGRIARYAWGRDYHEVIRPRLAALVARLEAVAGRTIKSRCFVDAVPLLERAVASRAGVGFFGKNTNLLQPTTGSWFFLAEVLLDLELPPTNRVGSVSCGKCQRCLDVCPTNAFAGPYKLDSRRCISYLTIENKGAIPPELREGLGEWVFGCDICQEMRPGALKGGPLPSIVRGQSEMVCPFNRFARDTAWAEFRPEAGVGPALDLPGVLAIGSDREFRQRFGGTALMRPRRRGLLRNAAVVAANIGCTGAVPALIDRASGDSEPLIRSHALWAVARLEPSKAAPMIDAAMSDPDSQVREEAERLKETCLN